MTTIKIEHLQHLSGHSILLCYTIFLVYCFLLFWTLYTYSFTAYECVLTCACVYELGYMLAMVCVWKSEENLQSIGSLLSCSGDHTLVVKISNGHLYRMSCLAGPGFFAVDQESLDSALDLPNHCFFTKSQTVKVVTCSKEAMWSVPMHMFSPEICSHSHITGF